MYLTTSLAKFSLNYDNDKETSHKNLVTFRISNRRMSELECIIIIPFRVTQKGLTTSMTKKIIKAIAIDV